MQFTVVFAVFPIIFLGELPDKTMFASLVLSTRGRPAIVWLGAAGAFVVHVVIAVTVGVALFHLLPPRALDAFVAAMFLGGATPRRPTISTTERQASRRARQRRCQHGRDPGARDRYRRILPAGGAARVAAA